jgi:cell division protein FtsN
LENGINNNTFEYLTYQGIADGIMVELHQKYNLRRRNKSLATGQTKKILPRGEIDGTVSKNAEKKTEKTNITDTQPTKTKSVETPTVKTQKAKASTNETKPSTQKKAEKKGIKAQNYKYNNTWQNIT